MNTPTKQTVYLPVKEQYEYSLAYWDKRDRSYQIEKDKNGKDIFLKEENGYFFTPEQLNQLLSDVIKDTLDTAAEKAEDWDSFHSTVNKESITSTFEETFNKFKL